ncbi:dihydropyrimidinase [Shouchella clausii]|uniref:dihydropyrimidinase n=1 Tax=Shouchella TaxID=2893057 RepID=UPI000BA6C8D3|nr:MULTISPECIES: dihydropyrimidinase [Shouchella]MCM3381753.1 dihydropyrimidinase [Shouchella rhizosphaerae]PAE80855.1 dihydropyrimidinase [Shouchella clausii]
MKRLIQNGTIITASDTYKADLLIEGETIAQIGQQLAVQGVDEIIDASGCFVFPGGIDPHTHLDMPFGGTVTKDDFETGTIAAAYGGTTTIIDFCLTEKEKPLHTAIEAWHKKAAGKAAIDYGFHLMIGEINEAVLNELPAIVSTEGISSFKVFMAYKHVFQADDATLFETLTKAKELGALVMVHAENGDVIDYLTKQALKEGKTAPIYHALTRPVEAEGEATGRACQLASLAQSQLYVVHVTCQEAVQQIAEARKQGADIWGETCPQYLVLDESMLRKPGFEGAKYVWSPPLREKQHQDALWKALKTGALQTIGSDQCSFDFAGQKDLGINDFTKIPNGGPIIEDRFSLLYSEGVAKGRIGLNEFVDLVSTRAAKLFGLYPKKGCIAVGADADIVLFDPQAERVLSARTNHLAVDYSAFEGMRVKGTPRTVLSRGKVIVRDQTYVGTPGEGAFLKRARYGELWTNDLVGQR